MTHDNRQLHLNVNITSTGRHPGGWRVLDDPASFVQVEFFQDIARIAERGTFDAVFLSDGVALSGSAPEQPFQSLEPTVLLTALAAVTEHVGLIGTASTTFNDPFNLARRFASVDHISHGRVALNVVTTYSPAAAANFGLTDSPDHDARYERAEEFVDVLFKLWDSWEDGALVGDQALAVFTDGDRIHPIDHEGRHFSVRGPLVVPRSPQGRPVLVQAGSSETGKRLGSRDRRHHLHRADHLWGRARVLRRHAGPGGQLRPRSRPPGHPAGPVPDRRFHRGRGTGPQGRA